MRRGILTVLAIVLTAILIGCQGNGTPNNEPKHEEPVAVDTHEGLHVLTINDSKVYVDIAKTYAAREQGLMYIKKLPEDEGMIFVYREPGERRFWMKDTLIPLSLAYIDENGVIFQIIDMKPLDESGHPSEKPAQYVLEVNKGWFERNDIEVGDRVENLPDPGGAQ